MAAPKIEVPTRNQSRALGNKKSVFDRLHSEGGDRKAKIKELYNKYYVQEGGKKLEVKNQLVKPSPLKNVAAGSKSS